MNITKLNIGDTYKNSVGNIITVEDIYDNGSKAELSCPKWASTYRNDTSEIIDFINSNKHTDYKPNTFNQEYEIGGILIYKNNISVYEIISITPFVFKDIKTERVFSNYGISHFTIKFKNEYTYNPPSNKSTTKVWKKEYFLNTKIIVDTPEKSKRFQELIVNLGINWYDKKSPQYTGSIYLYINTNGTLNHGILSNTFYNSSKREIFYDQIFYDQIFNNNNQSITTTNDKENNNTNDLSSTNLSGNRGKETATAIAFSKTSRIASSSRYTGNTVQGRTVKTRVGRSEIKFQAVTI